MKEFASVAAPLNRKIKKPEREECTITDDQMRSIDGLKKSLTSLSVLALPRDDKSLVLDTDANAEQLGCVSVQKQDEELLSPVGYFSRTLNDAERS